MLPRMSTSEQTLEAPGRAEFLMFFGEKPISAGIALQAACHRWGSKYRIPYRIPHRIPYRTPL